MLWYTGYVIQVMHAGMWSGMCRPPTTVVKMELAAARWILWVLVGLPKGPGGSTLFQFGSHSLRQSHSNLLIHAAHHSTPYHGTVLLDHLGS